MDELFLCGKVSKFQKGKYLAQDKINYFWNWNLEEENYVRINEKIKNFFNLKVV